MFGCTENQTEADEDETGIPRLTWLQPGRRARRTDRKTRRIRSLGRRMRRSTFVSLSQPSFRRNAASYQTGSRQTRGAGTAPQMILTDQTAQTAVSQLRSERKTEVLVDVLLSSFCGWQIQWSGNWIACCIPSARIRQRGADGFAVPCLHCSTD